MSKIHRPVDLQAGVAWSGEMAASVKHLDPGSNAGIGAE